MSSRPASFTRPLLPPTSAADALKNAKTDKAELQRIKIESRVGEGETYLLRTILSEFLAQYVSLNSFSKLRIRCTSNNEVFTWPTRIGRQITL